MSNHRIYDYATLPVPRLEIRWEPNTGEERERYSWIVAYELVIELPQGDIRRPDDTPEGPYLMRVSMGSRGGSRVGGSLMPDTNIESDGIDTPFRDGVHIMRDAAQLRLPAFACYRTSATQIMPLYSDSKHRWAVGTFDTGHGARE